MCRVCAVAGLMLLCGCSWPIVIPPPSFGVGVRDASPAAGPAPTTPVQAMPTSRGWNGPPPQAMPQGPNMPAPSMPLPAAPGISDAAAVMIPQQLATLEDENKVLTARVKQLENQLREKDRALVQASGEIQDATAQISRTREELKRWYSELETLRSKARNMERDSKQTLESIIQTLERVLQRENTRSLEFVEPTR